jgi:hypothetical protein
MMIADWIVLRSINSFLLTIMHVSIGKTAFQGNNVFLRQDCRTAVSDRNVEQSLL